MTNTKITNTYFVEQLRAAYKRKDGYLMGGTGQKMSTLKYGKGNWLIDQYKGAQHDKAVYWFENAERCWDCNGLLEGIYEQATGININARARDNYHSWCNPKGKLPIPLKYRLPGACVFSSSTNDVHNITHVGFLETPIDPDNPAGDWWVIEARGVMFGVVRTKLSQRNWKRWGLPTDYIVFPPFQEEPFDYVVIASSLNVRKRPGTEYDIIDTVHKGDKLAAVNPDGWSLIRHKGATGWVSSKYIKGANE